MAFGPGLDRHLPEKEKSTDEGISVFAAGGLDSVKVKNVGERKDLGPVSWAAIGNRYFLAALLPMEGSLTAFARRTTAAGEEIGLRSEVASLGPRQAVTYRIAAYLGPKDRALLATVGKGKELERGVDYGWFWWLAIPFLGILQFCFSFLRSYGLAIVALTLLVKASLFPISFKMFRSMKKMQELQPKMAALKAKFKGDNQGLQQATMAIYKEHKVNPMAGCLPMVVQIPVFFALYKVLYNAIELRGAGFLYIPDLSLKDPYYITPILMGVTMLIQQRMTPSVGDPMQAKTDDVHAGDHDRHVHQLLLGAGALLPLLEHHVDRRAEALPGDRRTREGQGRPRGRPRRRARQKEAAAQSRALEKAAGAARVKSPGNDTIAAVATGAGGGIGIVRISGPDALPIAARIFRGRGGRSLETVPPFLLVLGTASDPDSSEPIDEVLAVHMPEGRSYTGEPTVEIQGHGGRGVLEAVLQATLRAGARCAGPGEFTKRAFLSGRLDLTQAEAVAELICAEEDESRRAALRQLQGAVTGEVNRLREQLLDLVARVEAALDFEEGEIPDDLPSPSQIALTCRRYPATGGTSRRGGRRTQGGQRGVRGPSQLWKIKYFQLLTKL